MKALAAIAAIGAACLLSSCQPREGPVKPGQGTAVSEAGAEPKGLDPRAAFESSGLLGGLAALPEAPVALIAAGGVPEAGPALSLGGSLSTAAIARRLGPMHELALASGARVALSGPALALAASGDRIAVACAEPGSSIGGSLACYRAEGEGERLDLAWKKEGPPARRLLAVPGGRMAAADDSARLYLFDVATGSELWSKLLPSPAADIAYAPGMVLAVSGSRLQAFDETTGLPLWGAALTSKAQSLSAGDGSAFVLGEGGSLSAFALADGKGIGAATGPFDPSLRPVAEGATALVGLPGGGAAEIDVKSGQTQRTWAWDGRASFIAADADRVFAGVWGRAGRGLLIASRAGEAGLAAVGLEAPAFCPPLAQSGARGGLLVLLMDGSLELIGKRREASAAASALDAAIAPAPETAAVISSALGRFRGEEAGSSRRYLRFDLFAQGMPVDTEASFTAFRYLPPAAGRRSFAADPPSNGTVVAIFDEAGRELAASIDELASSSRASAYFEKGRAYWVVAGWTYQAQPQRFRLYLK